AMTFEVAGRVMVDMAARDTRVERRKARDGRRRWGRFARNADGAVAIEFAALIIPFCLLVFAILESCISFAAQQILSNATDDVARQFRTGQIRQADLESDPFLVRNRICGKLEMLVASG